MITKEEYLLECLQEECGEIIQAVSKIARFGPKNYNPETPNITNLEQLHYEVNDLLAICRLLSDTGVFPSAWVDSAKIAVKENKVLGHMESCGIFLYRRNKSYEEYSNEELWKL